MRFFKTVLIPVAAMAFASSSHASCFVCDEVVEFGAIHAACFMSDYEQFSSAAEASGRVEVDLSSCVGKVASGSRGLDAFPFFLDPKTSGEKDAPRPELRTTYILDLESLNCLHRILKEHSEPIDPSLKIDLLTDCR